MTDYQRKAIVCDARNFRAKAQNRVATSVLHANHQYITIPGEACLAPTLAAARLSQSDDSSFRTPKHRALIGY